MPVPSDTGYDFSTEYLRVKDRAVDNPANTSELRVTTKQFQKDPFQKDPFQKGLESLGKISTDLGPVSAMLVNLVQRRNREGPLFIFKDDSFDKVMSGSGSVRGSREDRIGSCPVLRP